MKVIGITGGVGAGKSTVLNILKNNFNSYIIMADEVSRKLCKKGNQAYEKLVDIFGDEILDDNGELNRAALAKIIFSQPNKRIVVNSIIHPLVKQEIVKKITELKIKEEYDYVFIEAALLIEDHYNVFCDEIWYIHVSEEIRRKRLKESRNYSDEKVTSIFKSQLSEDEFRRNSDFVIDNGESVDSTLKQIRDYLEG